MLDKRLLLALSVWVFIICLVGVATKQLPTGYLLLSVLFLVIYFKNVWFTTAFVLICLWLYGSSNSLFLFAFAFGLNFKSLKASIVAFVVVVAFIIVLYIINNASIIELVLVLSVWISLYILLLNDKKLLYLPNKEAILAEERARNEKTEAKALAEAKCKEEARQQAKNELITNTASQPIQIEEEGALYQIAKVKVIELTKTDYYILTERYLNGKSDKQIINKTTKNRYHPDHIIDRRAIAFRYNNLKDEYELASYLVHNFVKIIDSYDKQRLEEGNRIWNSRKGVK
jgi:hypothetical protein